MRSLDRTRLWAACVLVMLGTCSAAATTSAPGQEKLTCESESPGGDYREFSCPARATGAAQRFRFRVNFSGGHDDTMAAMTPTLDETPVACEPGSKTRLMGEDGDVSLECKFTVAPPPGGGNHVLRVVLRWSHAQYTGFEFDTTE